jgi:hypothetical protein
MIALPVDDGPIFVDWGRLKRDILDCLNPSDARLFENVCENDRLCRTCRYLQSPKQNSNQLAPRNKDVVWYPELAALYRRVCCDHRSWAGNHCSPLDLDLDRWLLSE